MARKRNKRMVIISDLHCGHRAGLTPLDWQDGYDHKSKTQRNKFGRIQRDMWAWYAATIASLRPIDILVVNGDAIDGKGTRSGATELLATDRTEQTQMAAECIKPAGARHIIMTFGTGYHVGADDDWEVLVAELVKADKIGSHEWITVNGVTFDFKHHIGSSALPHTRHTAISRDRLHNLLWAERDAQPKARFIIRSHVHYMAGAFGSNWLAMTTPALQGYGTKYGARRCSGLVEVGLIVFDVSAEGRPEWEAHTVELDALKAEALQL